MGTKELINLSINKRDYNSNNAWGFGGRRGKVYEFEGNKSMFIGSFDYRHAPSERVNLFFIDGKGVTKEEFIKTFN
jgi:hypothetical protein